MFKIFSMRNNVGTADKAIRITIAFTISILVFTKAFVGTTAIVGFLLVMILMMTCFKSNCPFYRLFGINTNKNLNDKAKIYERNQTLLRNYLKNYNERYSGSMENDFK